ALSRIDGATADIPVRLLPPPPRLSGSVRVNVGERNQRVTFTGTGLERIEGISSDGADVTLEAAGEDSARRDAVVRLRADAKPGARLTLDARVEGMAGAVHFPAAMQVVAARPKILEAKMAQTSELYMGVAPRDGELPAGSWVGVAIRVEPPA